MSIQLFADQAPIPQCKDGVCESPFATTEQEGKTLNLWDYFKKSDYKGALEYVKKHSNDSGLNIERVEYAIKNKLPIVEISTKKGEIFLSLYEDDAPNTVASFIYLAKHNYFNGLTFHRVVPGFVIQGGDPTGTGSGGPGYSFGLEISKKKHEKGALSMARTQDPNSNGSQFFITLNATPHLDGNYTVFGCVLKGQDIVDKIEQGDKMDKINILCDRGHDYVPKILSGKLPYNKK